MGSSSSTSMNFLNEVTNELRETNKASSITDCTQRNINIKIGEAKSGCSQSIEQRCTANADASIDSIVEAAQKAWAKASTDQKAGIALALNISKDSQDIRNIVKNKISQECDAQSVARIEQEGITYDIDICDAPLAIVNTGEAKSNCAIKSLLKTVQDTEGQSETVQDTDIGNTISKILEGLLIPFIIAGVVFVIFLISGGDE